MILVCNTCGEPYPGGGACDLHCGGRPARYSVGDPCGEVTGPDGDERVCGGTLVEAAIVPKSVADGIERVRAALGHEAICRWYTETYLSKPWMSPKSPICTCATTFAAHLRSLLEKAP